MMQEYDNINVTRRDESVVLSFPDGSSTEVPQDTIRRSAMLQEAIHAEDKGAEVSINVPRGFLRDWLQSVDALKATATSTQRGTDIAPNPRLLQFLRVRRIRVR